MDTNFSFTLFTIFQESYNDTSRQLPVIVDNELIPSPKLHPRTDKTRSNNGRKEAGPVDLTDIKTKLDHQPAGHNKKLDYGKPPNSLVEPYIIQAKIETVSREPPQPSPQPSPHKQPDPLSPNSVRVSLLFIFNSLKFIVQLYCLFIFTITTNSALQ